MMDDSQIYRKPLTDKQIADQSRAIISRESFYKRKSY